MKKIIIILCILLSYYVGNAQLPAVKYYISKGGNMLTTTVVRADIFPTLNTTAMNAISSPPNGLIIFNSDSLRYMVYMGTWKGLKYTDEGGSGGSSYTFPYSVVAPGNAIQLENDTTANPANYFYGRNSAGRRGWYPQSGITGVNIYNSDGTFTGYRTVNGNYNGFEMSNISSLNIGIDDNAGMTGGINIGGDNADNDYHIRTIGSVGESGIHGYRSENKLYSVTAGSDSSFVQTDGENGISIKAFDGSLKIPLLNYTLSTTGKKIMLRDTATGLVENIDPALIGGGISNIYTDDNALTTNIDTVRTNKGFNAITYSTTPAWDMRTGFDKSLTLTGDADLSITHSQDGDVGIILFIQDGSGGHNVTVPNADFEITQTAGDSTIASFVFDGVKYHWAVLGSSGGGTVTRIGALDSLTKSANGIQIAGDAIVPQTADATYPGFISLQDQVIGNGVKTFSRYIISDTLYGGTGSAGNLFMSTTTHATKGTLSIGAEFRYDQANNELRLGTTDFGNYSLQVPAYAAVGYGAYAGRIDIANSNNTTGSSKLKLIMNNGTGIGELTGFNPSATGTWGGVAYAGSTEILAYGKLMLSSVGAAYIITNNTLPSAKFNTNGNIDFGNKFTKYNNTAPTNGQLLIGHTSNGTFETGTLASADGSVTITNSGGGIDLSTKATGAAYTATLTAVANVSGLAVENIRYTVVGNVLTVSGTISLTTTLALTPSKIGVTYPPSLSICIADEDEISGQVSFKATSLGENAFVEGDVSNNTILITFDAITGSASGKITFTCSMIIANNC